MTRNAARGAVVLLGLFVVACTRVGHIQQTEPIRTLNFSGSHKAVAQCIQRRLGSKVHDDSFGERYVLYDSTKGRQAEGLTHYSITVAKVGPDAGLAEWRIVTPARGPGPTQWPPRTPELSRALLDEFWKPVEECAAQAK